MRLRYNVRRDDLWLGLGPSIWGRSQYAVTKACNIQGRSPNVVKVIIHTVRNYLEERIHPSVDCFTAPSMKLGYTYEVSAAVYPLREYAKGTQWKRTAAWSSSLPFICVLATPLDDIGNIIVFPEPSSTTRVLVVLVPIFIRNV